MDWRSCTRSGGARPLPKDPRQARPRRRTSEYPILFGGNTDKAIERILRWGAGSTAGGAPVEHTAPYAKRVRDAWTTASRSGEPRIATLAYFSLGEDAEDASRDYLLNYYRVIGDYAQVIAEELHSIDLSAAGHGKGIWERGFTELFDPTVAQLDQIDRLADAVL